MTSIDERLETDVRELRTDIKTLDRELRADIKNLDRGLRADMIGGFLALNQRIDRLYTALIASAGAVVVAFVGPHIF